MSNDQRVYSIYLGTYAEVTDGETAQPTAVLDRLLHYSTTLNIKGESYRLKEKRRAGLLSRSPVPAELEVSTEP